MHHDTKELLVGFGALLVFAGMLIIWPPFAEIVDRFGFSYLRDSFDLLLPGS